MNETESPTAFTETYFTGLIFVILLAFVIVQKWNGESPR